MKVTTQTAPVKGVGKPDYSRDVVSSINRAGLYLKYNQQSRMFARNFNHADAAYPLVPDTGLAFAGEAHLVDSDTWAALPIILPAGYSLTIIAVGFSTSQDGYIQVYLGYPGLPTICHNFGINASGGSVYENKLWELSTLWYDPTAASAPTLDAKLYNTGGGVLYGGVALWCIVELIGTPSWPTTKDCHCPKCGHIQTVSVEDSQITCASCGWIYMVTTFSSLKYANRVIGRG